MFTRSLTLTAVVLAATVLGTENAKADMDPSPVCGDVNVSWSVTAADALAVLRKAVGQPLTLTCSSGVYQATYGNPDDLLDGSSSSPGFLLGNALIIETDAWVTHLSLIGRQAGPRVKMGLYTDVGGNPAALVVASDATSLVVGAQEIPVEATHVAAGTYWLLALFNTQASVAFDSTDDSSTTKYVFVSSSIDDPLPDPITEAGDVDSYVGQKLNYWVNALQ